jgi:hypothetical protein
MANVRILGVVSGEAEARRLAYLNERVAATPELLAEAAPLNPGEIFRLAGRCEESRCVHFDGARCQLAVRIVDALPPVTQKLPPCSIRTNCRWYRQEGARACHRCPQIVTLNADVTATLQQVAGVMPPS